MEDTFALDLTTGQPAIDALFSIARSNDLDNKRHATRYPFFQPVIVSNADNSVHQFSAFSRDISETGMGLLHNKPLALGLVYLRTESAHGVSILSSRVAWCNEVGNGWYMSGVEFID